MSADTDITVPRSYEVGVATVFGDRVERCWRLTLRSGRVGSLFLGAHIIIRNDILTKMFFFAFMLTRNVKVGEEHRRTA